MYIATESDADSLHTLYREHHGWLRGWLRGRLGCSEQAADLAHDAFERLLRRQRDAEPVREPRALLNTIAHNLLVNHWRRKDLERAWHDTLASQPEPLAVSPEHQHLMFETLLRIDAMLRGLPPRPRRAFLLSRLDGLGYAEIGRELGVSERMVKKYMAQVMLHCLNIAA